MKTKKYKITVGIPAYNEELSIKNTLNAVLSQSDDNFKVKKITVYSDGSTDDTNKIVSGFKNKEVALIKGVNKKGKTHAIKELLGVSRNYNVDFLIIVDADLLLESKYIFRKLIQKLSSSDKVAAVSGFSSPLKPNNFSEKIGYFGFKLWEYMISHSGDRELYFRSSDYIVALRVGSFLSEEINRFSYMHDEFYYLFSKKHGKLFLFEKKASTHHRLPKNIPDYISQMTRYITKHVSSRDEKLLGKGFGFTPIERLKALVVCMEDDFILGLCYFLIQTYVHLLVKFGGKSFDNKWQQITSTK